jgi:hypothetical protein
MIDDSDNPLFVVPVAEPLKERQWSDAALEMPPFLIWDA